MGSLGGLLRWLVGTLVVVLVGTFIINRVAFLKQITG
jgi:fluoride ion exporter CrcB/FEX